MSVLLGADNSESEGESDMAKAAKRKGKDDRKKDSKPAKVPAKTDTAAPKVREPVGAAGS